MAGGESYLVGLVGTGIGPSLTPALHELEATALGLRYLYRLLDLSALGLPATTAAVGEVLDAARLTGFTGLNLTHPVKQLVIDHLDELSPEAGALGAVNTVLFRDGRMIGHNTDVSGFARGVGLGLADAALDRVLVVGAGGAGAAVAHALLTMGAGTVRVLDTDRGRGDRLVARLRERFGAERAEHVEDLAAALRDADGLAHATPTGMREHPGSAVPVELLRPRLWVADVVYRPLETELLAAARAQGCRVLDGGKMAVFQAVDAFRLFTGRQPDPYRMLRHFDALVGADQHVRSATP